MPAGDRDSANHTVGDRVSADNHPPPSSCSCLPAGTGGRRERSSGPPCIKAAGRSDRPLRPGCSGLLNRAASAGSERLGRRRCERASKSHGWPMASGPFWRSRGSSPPNNAAERALRQSVNQRQISHLSSIPPRCVLPQPPAHRHYPCCGILAPNVNKLKVMWMLGDEGSGIERCGSPCATADRKVPPVSISCLSALSATAWRHNVNAVRQHSHQALPLAASPGISKFHNHDDPDQNSLL